LTNNSPYNNRTTKIYMTKYLSELEKLTEKDNIKYNMHSLIMPIWLLYQ